ncbi:MAG: MmcQ/YjbR family DNA-binding protein [Oscillospiraceae bacterium]
MTCEEFLEFCRNIPGASVDQPFDGDFDTYAARHTLSRKWFALVMLHEGRHIVNLKCDPQEADLLRKLFKGVVPAYHMNKTHWNTIILNSDLPDEEIKRMTMNSFALTDKRK